METDISYERTTPSERRSDNRGCSFAKMAVHVRLNRGVLKRLSIGCFASILVLIWVNRRYIGGSSASFSEDEAFLRGNEFEHAAGLE